MTQEVDWRMSSLARRALTEGAHDFTKGSLVLGLGLLALPMMLEPIADGVFSIVDIYFVSRLGEAAVGAVGLTEAMMTIVYVIGMGLGIPTTALVARAVGANAPPEREADPPIARADAGRVVVQANLLGLLVALPVGVAGAWAGPWLLAVMGANAEAIATGSGFVAVSLGATPIITLLFINGAALRGSGDVVVAFKALWIANLLNMVLDPIFIFGWGPVPGWGVTGAAVATVVGRGFGVLYMVAKLTRGTHRIRVTRADLRIDMNTLRRLGKMAFGGVGQLFVEMTSWVGVARVVAMSGPVALAGYTIAMRLLMFALMPAWGLSAAAATLVGHNLAVGANKRAFDSVRLTGAANMVYCSLVMLILTAFATPLVALFTETSAVRHEAVAGLRIVSFGFLLYAWGMVFAQAFNGAGDTRTPLRLNICTFWLFQLPLAYGLSIHVDSLAGARGVYVALVLAYSLNAALAMLLFARRTTNISSLRPRSALPH